MTLAAFLEILTYLDFAFVFMILGAAVFQLIGAKRIARWLRLPPDDDYE